uniref:endoplasmic reticulum resident protein 44 n=1 Tax=Ciona intestinalis TaxID=7719 RepID=UPI000180B826|nr:endoplasmic reticulum resident protein 44 [Ciona intestinalis]XP_018670204.1 endoplasmic reticulum resident protein 44 [Ciona intestinalis]|eukprot:XP_009860646.1 endoplasmic reticulum resident protein 44 [Ciona intestinalis]
MMFQVTKKLLSSFIYFIVLITQCSCEVLQLDSTNLESTLANNQVVFVNFYADWCRFSQMLAPIFEQTAEKIATEYPTPGMVTLAKVDCDRQGGIAQQYHVSKYPTMKLFYNGKPAKREYRGNRTPDGIAAFIRDHLKDPVKEFANLDVIYELPRQKRNVVGYFTSKESEEFKVFNNVAKILKDDCDFHAGFGEVSKPERTTGDNIIFKPDSEAQPEMVFLGSLTNQDLLHAWAQDKCVPLVREITFANGEELTEEGLPFVILFHKKEDTESLEAYRKEVSRLVSFKTSVNFLVADCETFSHPLHHLGKSVRDCPLVAIDSFKHMYMFPNFNEINTPNKLKQFILDLQSGKLHREFHHGPDPHIQALPEDPSAAPAVNDNPEVISAEVQASEKPAEEVETSPPESIFKQLKPSEHRYTLTDRDEL